MKRANTGSEKLARGALLLIGVATLLWSGLEDSDSRAVTILGTLASLLIASRLVTRLAAGRLLNSIDITLAGALAGGLASLCTVALMLFKNLRHAHIFPDYPADMLLAILERLPLWTVAGGLAGLGIGLLLSWLPRNTREP